MAAFYTQPLRYGTKHDRRMVYKLERGAVQYAVKFSLRLTQMQVCKIQSVSKTSQNIIGRLVIIISHFGISTVCYVGHPRALMFLSICELDEYKVYY